MDLAQLLCCQADVAETGLFLDELSPTILLVAYHICGLMCESGVSHAVTSVG